jgi:hypothetical protein
MRELLADSLHRVDAIHLRHLQAHQGHIRSIFSVRFDRFQPIFGLGNKFHIRLLLQRECDPVADKRMVVCA